MRPIDTAVSQILNDARRSACITVNQLAEHLGIHYDTASKKLRGERPMHLHEVVAISVAVGQDPAAVLRDAFQQAGSEIGPFPPEMLRRCLICQSLIPADAHSRTTLCEREECFRKARVLWEREYVEGNREQVNARRRGRGRRRG